MSSNWMRLRDSARWYGRDFDDDAVRHGFIGYLRRRGMLSLYTALSTPYWRTDYNDFFLFDATLIPEGAEVLSVNPDAVALGADSVGTQTDGLCLRAEFEVPTELFTERELRATVCGFTFTPSRRRVRALLRPEFITRLDWWYDGAFDERNETDENETDENESEEDNG